jgi:hypothetical protein
MGAFISWGFENLPLPFVTSKLGMTTLRSDVLGDRPVVVRSVSRVDWDRARGRS